MLERLELYNCKIIEELKEDGFICKCRFSHEFRYIKLDDWCVKCVEPKFQQDMICEINYELNV